MRAPIAGAPFGGILATRGMAAIGRFMNATAAPGGGLIPFADIGGWRRQALLKLMA